MPEEKKPQGWADVQITSQMPLDILVNFMNVLNQRLVQIENVTQVPYENRMVSLTELYHIQQEEALKQQAKQAQEKEESPRDNPEHQGA